MHNTGNNVKQNYFIRAFKVNRYWYDLHISRVVEI